MKYTPPDRDLKFLMHDVLEVAKVLTELPGFVDVDVETIDHIIAEGGKFASDIVYPINRAGDSGCEFDPNTNDVKTPAGYKDVYEKYCASGWPTLGAETAHGGQGLPQTINHLFFEMLFSASSAWSMYPMAAQGVYQLLNVHGSDAQKATYLEKLASGEWTGTMCLTEPQAGTDLGLIKTKALPRDDGTYSLTGSKIFTSGGEHDLTENIVHLVLARLPDARSGVKGISLFLVPKYRVESNGSLEERNPVFCSSIESKMGIRGSSTCQMSFDGAVGELVGEPHRGLAAMFVMMNAARVAVALQGLGVSEASYQLARQYAQERRQSRALGSTDTQKDEADAIIVHPDVRRMLMTMKAQTEGGRALVFWVSLMLDQMAQHSDESVKQECTALVSLLTPIMKSVLTDNGFSGSNLALQVHGGHGYIKDVGVEQYVRDARIFQIYEGTNAIQSLDLLGRKILMTAGAPLRVLQKKVNEALDACSEQPQLEKFVTSTRDLSARIDTLTQSIAVKGMANPNEVGASSVDYLTILGHLVQSHLWIQMASAALAADDSSDPFYQSKFATAEYYFAKLLPEVESCFTRIESGCDTLMALTAEQF